MTAPGVGVDPAELFHIGIVVPEMSDAMQRLSSLIGIRWGPLIESDTSVADGAGDISLVHLKSVYSTNGPTIELTEAVPDTIWACNPHSNIHHIGFWSGALAATSEGLRSAGCPLELSGWDPGQAERNVFSYHQDVLGVRVELVDAALRPVMASMWESG